MTSEFEKYIRKHGEYLGQGISREAYRLEGKVYKLLRDYEDDYQMNAEEQIYAYIPERFKHLFPNPRWLGHGIVEMDEVEIAQDIVPWGDIRVEIIAESLSEETHHYLSNTDIVRFLVHTGLTHMMEELEDFVSWLHSENLNARDLFDNSTNFGMRNGELKFIDWGLMID